MIRALVRIDVFFGQFEADAGWILIARFDIVDRQGDTRGAFVFLRNRLTQIGGEGGDAALARQVIADKGNSFDESVFIGTSHLALSYISNQPVLPTRRGR